MPESPQLLPRIGASWHRDTSIDALSAFLALSEANEHAVWLEDAVANVSVIAVGDDVFEAPSLGVLDLDDRLVIGWIAYDGSSRWLRPDRWIVYRGDEAQLQSHGMPWTLPLPAADRGGPGESVTAHPAVNDADYEVAVRECQRWIQEGDSYVACLTTQWHAPRIDGVATYRNLRTASPLHRGGYLRLGDTEIASISPERFVSLRDGEITTSPIKGTRKRHEDSAIDAMFARELLESVKERAENVMIVDLCRNDLHRVCEPGTVSVSQLLQVESFPTVHQLVSTVHGSLRSDVAAADAIAALFPAGSMTGAPKERTVELLEQLEPEPRGLYSGCFGWIAGNEAELTMTIRTVVVTPEGTSFGVGGGVTSMSAPREEVAEMHLKAAALKAALVAQPSRDST